MTRFFEKTVKLLSASKNSYAIDALFSIFETGESAQIRTLAFNALFKKRIAEFNLRLIKGIFAHEENWLDLNVVSREQLAVLLESALFSEDETLWGEAVRIITERKLHEALPLLVRLSDHVDPKLASLARKTILQLAELFYTDLVDAPTEAERQNLDRRRRWFVQQLDMPIRQFAAHRSEEILRAVLIIAKKDYATMSVIVGREYQGLTEAFIRLMQTDPHRSFVRLLLSYVPDQGSPAIVDQILTTRSDRFFIRRLLEMIGEEPSTDFLLNLGRFTGFLWLDADNPDLPDLIQGFEPNAIQLVRGCKMPKADKLKFFRFFLELPSVPTHRAAAKSLKHIDGDEATALMLEFLHDSDPTTTATLFRNLMDRNCKEAEKHFAKLADREQEEIRAAIYDTMPNLRTEAFAAKISQLDPALAETLGRFIRLIDPWLERVIQIDLASPIAVKRYTACLMTGATNLSTVFVNHLIELTDDSVIQVRVAAAGALGRALTKESFVTLKSLLQDRCGDVRIAAEQAMRRWIADYHAQTSAAQQIAETESTVIYSPSR